MKIDLYAYARELGHWLDAFSQFVDIQSQPRLLKLLRELEDGRELRPTFEWKTPKPVWSRPSKRYDGVNKTPHEVQVGWEFEALFFKEGPPRKPTWSVKRMVTHVRVRSASDGQEVLHFHHDLKEPKQLGPQIHLQLSESFQKNKGKIPMAVPRFPSASLLPTDCLDLALAEFFPFSWPQQQSKVIGIQVLRAAQRARMMRMATALHQVWRDTPNMTLVAATQRCDFPNFTLA